MLIRLDPALVGRSQCVQVGRNDLNAKTVEDRYQRLLPDRKAQANSSWLEAARIIQSLADETPLPHFAVHVILASQARRPRLKLSRAESGVGTKL